MLWVTASCRSRASAWRSSAAACLVSWRCRRSISMTAASASPTVPASRCSSSENGPPPASRATTSAPVGPRSSRAAREEDAADVVRPSRAGRRSGPPSRAEPRSWRPRGGRRPRLPGPRSAAASSSAPPPRARAARLAARRCACAERTRASRLETGALRSRDLVERCLQRRRPPKISAMRRSVSSSSTRRRSTSSVALPLRPRASRAWASSSPSRAPPPARPCACGTAAARVRPGATPREAQADGDDHHGEAHLER